LHSPLDTLSAAVDASPQAILQREARTHKAISDEDIFDNGAGSQYADRTPPRHGIAPDLSTRAESTSQAKDSMADRGIYHASDAMKSMYDMGDAPSCATCGAIMTRSGSCYRCMSCGSTSGCS
jgi:ribonucleoside-diphosphate reductase alpha chain